MIATLEDAKKQMATSSQLQTITTYLQSINFTPQNQQDVMILGLYKQVTDTSTIDTLIKSLKQLQTGISSLQVGNKDLTTGITQLKEGTITLAGKSKELTSGAKSLYKGTDFIKVS